MNGWMPGKIDNFLAVSGLQGSSCWPLCAIKVASILGSWAFLSLNLADQESHRQMAKVYESLGLSRMLWPNSTSGNIYVTLTRYTTDLVRDKCWVVVTLDAWLGQFGENLITVLNFAIGCNRAFGAWGDWVAQGEASPFFKRTAAAPNIKFTWHILTELQSKSMIWATANVRRADKLFKLESDWVPYELNALWLIYFNIYDDHLSSIWLYDYMYIGNMFGVTHSNHSSLHC